MNSDAITERANQRLDTELAANDFAKAHANAMFSMRVPRPGRTDMAEIPSDGPILGTAEGLHEACHATNCLHNNTVSFSNWYFSNLYF